MEKQANQAPTLSVSIAMIEGAKHPKDMVELAAVRDNWIKTYERCHGRTDGAERYEREKILFIQAVTANNQLTNTLPFTRYASFMRMALAGVSLDDGESALVARGKNCTLAIQWKGRRQQIISLPQVTHVDDPVVVYDCDCDPNLSKMPFVPTRGMNGLHIPDWQPAAPRPANAQIRYVYVLVLYKYATRAYLMERDDVLTIRDEYSDSYKAYVADLRAIEASKATQNPWPAGKVLKTKYGTTETYWADLKVPAWVTREEEMYKKTMIHRLWKSIDKLPHQKYVDDEIAKELLAAGEIMNPYEDPGAAFTFSADFAGPGAKRAPRKPRESSGGGSEAPTGPAAGEQNGSQSGTFQQDEVKQPEHVQYSPEPHNPGIIPPPQQATPPPTPAPAPAAVPTGPAPTPVYNTVTMKWEIPGEAAPAPLPAAPAPPAYEPPPAQPMPDPAAANGLGNLDEPF